MRFQKGQTVKGPAIIRRRYHDEWEYALLLPDATFIPFGCLCPTGIAWVYQVTWKDVLQKIVNVPADDVYSQEKAPIRDPESKCWWMVPRLRTPELEQAFREHAQL